MSNKIPLLVPTVPKFEAIAKYLKRIDESRRYSNFGPLETELRERLADMWKVPSENVVTACNATLALQGAIETSEHNAFPWKVPSWTFIATPLAIQKAGKPFDFVDVDLQTWRALFSEEDENLVDVLPFGDDLDMNRLRVKPITNLVVDAAASFAALSRPLPTSSHRFAIIFSLHATKLFPAGEGAILVTNCPEWANKFRAWTNFGFSFGRKSNHFGTNAKLSEYGAAVALGSLDEFKDTIEKHEGNQKYARRMSENLGLTVQPSMQKGLVSPYWIVELKGIEQKNDVTEALDRSGIEHRDWWESGCHKEPVFSALNVSLPNTDKISANTLGLPMHTQITMNNLKIIEEVLQETLSLPKYLTT